MAPSNNRWRIPFIRSGGRHDSATTLPMPALPVQYQSGSIFQQGPDTTPGSVVVPSPSVEPPQVSAYTFNASPSPAYSSYSHYSTVAPHYSPYNEELSQAPGGSNSFPLEHIPESEEPSLRESSLDVQPEDRQIEEAPRQSPMPLSTGQLPVASQSTYDPLVSPVSMPSYSDVEFPEPLVVPRKPQMNPAAFAITPTTGPRPPDDIVLHNEVTRHGAMFNSETFETPTEAAYQVAIAPPAAPRPPAPSTLIDPSVLNTSEQAGRPQSPLGSMGLNTTTWVSGSEAISNLAPPVGNNPMSSPNPNSTSSEAGIDGLIADKPGSGRDRLLQTQPASYDVTKPTCSINLVCYRSGARGCDLQQIQCILKSKFTSQQSFEYTLNKNPHLIDSDVRFFREMRRLFQNEMSGFFRRSLSLKSLRAFRILAYTPTTRPTVVPFDDFVLQEMMYAFQHPDRLTSQDEWVQWVFRLRRHDRRHAIEFVEGWNTTRIAIAGTIPWLSSCIVGIAWTAAGGDIQTAFTVASFILTSSSVILALLAIISGIESSGRRVV